MARRRNPPELVRAKWELAERLRTIRTERFGQRGLADLARQMGVPIRTWYSYETGVTVPGEIVLRFIQVTLVEPRWLLHGSPPKYQTPDDTVLPDAPMVAGDAGQPWITDPERDDELSPRPFQEASLRVISPAVREYAALPATVGCLELDRSDDEPLAVTNGSQALSLSHDRRSPEGRHHYFRMVGHAMTPILSDGAFVAFSELEEDPSELDGKLVLARVDGRPLVRWLHRCGHLALLRAENPTFTPKTHLIDFERDTAPPIHRVLWVGTAY